MRDRSAAPRRDPVIRARGDFVGVEVANVDFSEPLGREAKQLLADILAIYGAFVVRDQTLSTRQLVDHVSQFGRARRAMPSGKGTASLPGWPEVEVISNEAWGATARDALAAGDSEWRSGFAWGDGHGGTCLHAIEVPEEGGDLHFISTFEAYQRLPEGLKGTIRDLSILRGQRPGGSSAPASQPLVRIEPMTGRPALQLGRWKGARIAGYSAAASERLLAELWEYGVRAASTWTHRFMPGDFLHWDDRWVMVKADPMPKDSDFILWRTRYVG